MIHNIFPNQILIFPNHILINGAALYSNFDGFAAVPHECNMFVTIIEG